MLEEWRSRRGRSERGRSSFLEAFRIKKPYNFSNAAEKRSRPEQARPRDSRETAEPRTGGPERCKLWGEEGKGSLLWRPKNFTMSLNWKMSERKRFVTIFLDLG